MAKNKYVVVLWFSDIDNLVDILHLELVGSWHVIYKLDD